jgi:transcriptional regulator with XRE-family HTH domain
MMSDDTVTTRYDRSVTSSPPLGPALLKRRLGEELRKLRIAAEVTVSGTANELGSSEAKVRHVENGRNVPSKPDLTVMISLYGASKKQHEDLEELRQAAGRRAWWSSYRLPTWLHNLVGLEADATLIRTFELELVPGLLQTEEYARAVYDLTPHAPDRGDIEKGVKARLKRQERLTGDRPVELQAVISEAALHRIRTSEFAPEQFRHLLKMAELPNVSIAILPFSTGLHRSMSGSFLLMSFPPDVSPPIGYFEYAYGGQLEHDSKIVAQLSEMYENLRRCALDTGASMDFISAWL